MLSEGDAAPDFDLPGTEGEEVRLYRLSEFTAEGPVLLSFYPFDFAPTCTREVCGLRDTEWFEFVDELDILAVSTDGPFAHMEFIDAYNLRFPLLSDTDATVAERYGTVHDEWNGFERIMQRSTFLLDTDLTVRHVAATEDPLADPDLDPIREAVGKLDA
jgi:peroxiredoxin